MNKPAVITLQGVTSADGAEDSDFEAQLKDSIEETGAVFESFEGEKLMFRVEHF